MIDIDAAEWNYVWCPACPGGTIKLELVSQLVGDSHERTE